MTPKEKALDLYFKYEKEIRIYRINGFEYDGRKAKNCALIAIDEIMDSIPSLDECKSLYIFWSNVKHELNKL